MPSRRTRGPSPGDLALAVAIACVGCGARPTERAPADLATGVESPAESEHDADCVPGSATGDDGWTRFRVCAPSPSWPGRDPVAEPWAPGVVQPALAEARERLLALGLPDVRGAELRDVEIVVHDVWGESERVRARGLLLPAAHDAPRFALTHTPLVWPVHAVGPSLDIVASCQRALDLLDRAEAVDDRSDEHWALVEQAATECPVSWAWPILVDRGRADLVVRLMAGSSALSADDLVRGTVELWLQALFERAITHFMQGEDAIARDDVARIARLRTAAIALGIEADELAYLEPTDVVRADLERRAQMPPQERAMPPEEEPVPASSIPALIDSLEDVDARQWGQPGGVSFASDPRVRALIRAGEPAVPALLECLEHDRRLTRSVHFWRDFSRDRSVLGVHEACYVAVASIIDEDFFEIVATGDDLSMRGERGRARVAGAIRAYWGRWGGVPPIERRWAVLADDAASPAHWARAADWLTDDAPEPRESTMEVTWIGAEDEAPMQGEPLRRERGDALLALLVSRAATAAAASDHDATCSLAGAAIVWAGEAPTQEVLPIALACVREAQCACRDWLAARLGHTSDEIAMEWLARSDRLFRGSGWDAESTTTVLADLLDIPVVARAADARVRAMRVDAAFAADVAQDIDGNLFGHAWTLALRTMPAAIDLLDRALASRRRAATLELVGGEEPGSEPYPVVRRRNGWASVQLPEPLEAPRVVRVCDLAARSLAGRLHVPFSLGWDDARRDAAIREMRSRLDRMLRERWSPGEPEPEPGRGIPIEVP